MVFRSVQARVTSKGIVRKGNTNKGGSILIANCVPFISRAPALQHDWLIRERRKRKSPRGTSPKHHSKSSRSITFYVPVASIYGNWNWIEATRWTSKRYRITDGSWGRCLDRIIISSAIHMNYKDTWNLVKRGSEQGSSQCNDVMTTSWLRRGQVGAPQSTRVYVPPLFM